MIAEPDTAGGTILFESEGRMMKNQDGALVLDEFGLASALNSAANMRLKGILMSPSYELPTIPETGNKDRSKRRSLKRRVTICESNYSATTNTQALDQTTRIISLPWRVSDGSRDIDGRYTGDINLSFQPHGRGTLRFDDGKSNIAGQWRNGVLVQHHKNDSDDLRPAIRRSSSVPESLNTQGRSGEHIPFNSPQKSDTTDASSSTSLAHCGYELGDEVKEDHHVVIPKSVTESLQYASCLNALDFAFVLRSNGSWTYAIVAERFFHKELGLVLRFVLDKKGTTKTIRRKYWGKGVRPVNSSAANV